MFRLISFLLTLCVLAFLSVGGYWYVTTPQPPGLGAQGKFAIDTALFRIRSYQQTNDAADAATWRDLARDGNSAAQLQHAKILFAAARTNPTAYIEALATLGALADKGIPEGQNAYGVMVRDGLGGAVADKIEAYKWFTLASRRGSKLADQNAVLLSHGMTTTEIYDAENRANVWLVNYYKKR